jgi:hypothetical protein
MADEPSIAEDEGQKDGFVKGLSKAVVRRAVVPLAASLSTAGTAYLTKKSSELWNEKVLPKVREKGGGRAVAGEVLEKAAGKLGGRGSGALSAIAERLQTPDAGTPRRRDEPQASTRDEESKQSDGRREEERRERRQRRQQRQRALEQSGSS